MSRKDDGPGNSGPPWLWLLGPALALAGCLGYRLGSTLPPDIKTVHVPAFVNETGEPLLETETTTATLREVQREGHLRVVEAGQADAVLSVRLVRHWLEPTRFERDRPKSPAEYRLKVAAEIEFKRRATGELLAPRKRVEGEAIFEPGGDLSLAKQRALPTAAADLAHDIVESIVEFW